MIHTISADRIDDCFGPHIAPNKSKRSLELFGQRSLNTHIIHETRALDITFSGRGTGQSCGNNRNLR